MTPTEVMTHRLRSIDLVSIQPGVHNKCLARLDKTRVPINNESIHGETVSKESGKR